MKRTLTACAAFVALSLFTCCKASEIDVAAERHALDQVMGAKLDRPDGQIDVSWPAYLAADPRLTEQERQEFADFFASWEQRVQAGEELVEEGDK